MILFVSVSRVSCRQSRQTGATIRSDGGRAGGTRDGEQFVGVRFSTFSVQLPCAAAPCKQDEEYMTYSVSDSDVTTTLCNRLPLHFLGRRTPTSLNILCFVAEANAIVTCELLRTYTCISNDLIYFVISSFGMCDSVCRSSAHTTEPATRMLVIFSCRASGFW